MFIDSVQIMTEMSLMLITIDHSQCSTKSWSGWRTLGTQCLNFFFLNLATCLPLQLCLN